MVTFLHLSDIHFAIRNQGTQFDLDERLREAIFDDIRANLSDVGHYDGILISGDIAFSGKPAEYGRATKWLEELCVATGSEPTAIFVVPGNHDVDRTFVERDSFIWVGHRALRECVEKQQWLDRLQAQLTDKSCDSLRPLHNYNEFAQAYTCRTDAKRLSWRIEHPKPLSDGTRIAIFGINSAIVSDVDDARGNLLVSDFQFHELTSDRDFVNLLLCHHPPTWLKDDQMVSDQLKAYVHVALFGHEHAWRCRNVDGKLHLMAGAMHPDRHEADWTPTYHIVQLDVDLNVLTVRVVTRQWSPADLKFLAARHSTGLAWEDHRIALPVRGHNMVKSHIHVPPHTATAGPMTDPIPDQPVDRSAFQRELVVHFFRLGIPLRYRAAEAAGLLKENDNFLEPQALWSEIFYRAVQENRLQHLWDAVALREPRLRNRPNPFQP